LRFEAGRALFQQMGDLLVLQHLKTDDLKSLLETLDHVLQKGRRLPVEAQKLLTQMSERKRLRVKALLKLHGSQLAFASLRRAARYSAHRAGLWVSGDLGASLTALRALGGREDEQLELIRFAASERYFQMTQRV
jgi:hypothetical protein